MNQCLVKSGVCKGLYDLKGACNLASEMGFSLVYINGVFSDDVKVTLLLCFHTKIHKYDRKQTCVCVFLIVTALKPFILIKKQQHHITV